MANRKPNSTTKPRRVKALDQGVFEVHVIEAPGVSRDQQLDAIIGLAHGALENKPELFQERGRDEEAK